MPSPALCAECSVVRRVPGEITVIIVTSPGKSGGGYEDPWRREEEEDPYRISFNKIDL